MMGISEAIRRSTYEFELAKKGLAFAKVEKQSPEHIEKLRLNMEHKLFVLIALKEIANSGG